MPKKILILRGNSAGAGTFPDEEGHKIAWPEGALHVHAASEYARSRGFESIVLDVPGQPQGQGSPQAKAALKEFFNDQEISAFYGFSGGAYNLRHILEYLALNKPEALRRIILIVVLGVPDRPKAMFESSRYNDIVRNSNHHAAWAPVSWEVVYGTNPPPSALPKGIPKNTDTHMFGPDALLAGGWVDHA
jgi:hypothetical protein